MAFNVALIFTRHREAGFCNSTELFQIIEAIQPEVIFEELSQSLYQEAYVSNTLNNLESAAIKKYLAIRDVPHIPVDTFERPKNYDRDQEKWWHSLKGGANQHSFHLRGLSSQIEGWTANGGFHFLNSDENAKMFLELDVLKEAALEILNDDNLYRFACLDKDVIEKREEFILDSVYAYSKENEFVNGLMFIGSGHMKSIKQKISERQKTEEVKINWRYFSDVKIATS